MNEVNNQPPEFSEDELHMPENGFKTVETEHHGKLGLILGLLIIALVLILAGLYLWYTNSFQADVSPNQQNVPVREVPEMPNDPETANSNAAVQQLETLSPANDMESIDADTMATDLETLDAELTAIDAELDMPSDQTESSPQPDSETQEDALSEPTVEESDSEIESEETVEEEVIQ